MFNPKSRKTHKYIVLKKCRAHDKVHVLTTGCSDGSVEATNFGHPCFMNSVSANSFSVPKNRTLHTLWSTELSGARRNLLF